MTKTWDDVIDEINEGYQSSDSIAIRYMIDSASELTKASKNLENVDKETIEHAAKQMKTTNKEAQSFIMKTIPVVGVLFSITLALKNFAFGIYEYKKLIDSSSSLNLGIKETLMVESYRSIFESNKDNPELISEIIKPVLITKTVWDEGISLVANSIDAIKDIIFLIADIITMGYSTWLDVGLSAAIFVAEYKTEGDVLSKFDDLISDIKRHAAEKSADEAFSDAWWKDEDEIEKDDWWKD